jgi:biopolymer transport protein ExbD
MSAIQDIQNDETRLEMTPMIDVTFLLLIFFLCTIRFRSLEGKLAAYLPKGDGVTVNPSDEVEAMRLSIEVVHPGQKILADSTTQQWVDGADGPFRLVGHEVEYQLGRDRYPGTEAGRASLRARLEAQLLVAPDRRLTIHSMSGTLQADAVEVLDICLGAGLSNVTFAGSHKP